ncbi:gustatory receptor 67 isoform X1 [Bombyx mori]|uniref:gustatory receptor 67 isoform X1 n=1 Tax=Bombyx mori TaxID=7091 RepID=UPI002ED366D1
MRERKKKFNKLLNTRNYNNIVEALLPSDSIRKISGVSVVYLAVNSENRIVTKFSFIGTIFFLFWYILYFYCTYKAHSEDQTILRTIYNTKLKRYGDDFERIASIIYVTYSMWKVPFRMSGNQVFIQRIVDIDSAIENMGEAVDYNKNAKTALVISIAQLGDFLVRMFCIWLSLENLSVIVPTEKLYQVVYTDALSFVITSHYCFSLIVLRGRYKYINKVLSEIKTRSAWEYKVFVRNKVAPDLEKVQRLQDRIVCEKIKACARIYSMLYKATEAINRMYGTALVLTMLLYLVFIILYMFYFMEATASGLLYDIKKYVDFLICVFWQMSHALSIIYANVYFSESITRETKNTSFVIHEIINSDFDSEVNTEGARSVFTYLVIVLQFVTDRV